MINGNNNGGSTDRERDRDSIGCQNHNNFKLSQRMTQLEEEENEDDDIFLTNGDKEVDSQIKMGNQDQDHEPVRQRSRIHTPISIERNQEQHHFRENLK